MRRWISLVLTLIFLLAPASLLATQTQTPVFTPSGGLYIMPINEMQITVPAPNAASSVSVCYIGSGTCVPGSSGTQYFCPGSPTNTPCGVYISPAGATPTPLTQEVVCANALDPRAGYTQSNTNCQLYKVEATLATGDGRGVQPEPTFPQNCSTIAANKYIVSTPTLNLDPWNATISTPSKLGGTGGTSLEPSSTPSPTYTLSEADDTTAVQNLINGSPTGTPVPCVELTQGAGGQAAFIMKPWHPHSNVTVVVDPGVTVFASRNPADFGGGSCGTIPGVDSSGNPKSSSCGTHWITTSGPSSTSAAIMGYGSLDARCWDKAWNGTANVSASGWCYNRVQSLCNSHGTTTWQGVTCPSTAKGGLAYGPDLIHLRGANSFTLYMITAKDCGNFCVYWGANGSGTGSVTSGLTAWGIKIIAPYEISNSDGFDPSYNSTNISLINSFISNGDNHVAVKSCGGGYDCSGNNYPTGPEANISILNLQTGSGIGVTIGANTSGGVSNVLVNGLRQNGNTTSGQSVGFGINTAGIEGGLVSTVSYLNVCSQNEGKSLLFSSNYESGSGVSPSFSNLLVENANVLKGPTYPNNTGTANSGQFIFQGYAAVPNIMPIALSNVIAGGSITGSSANNYLNVIYGPDPVSSTIQTTMPAGSHITVTNNVSTSNPAYTCSPYTGAATPNSSWQPLIGEMFLSAGGQQNLQGYVGTAPATYTLGIYLRPAMEVGAKESPGLATQTVTFYDCLNGCGGGKTTLGTGTLSANGTLATFPLTSVAAGTHVYSANYNASAGDANYPSYTWGALLAQVNGPANPGTLNVVGPMLWRGGVKVQ